MTSLVANEHNYATKLDTINSNVTMLTRVAISLDNFFKLLTLGTTSFGKGTKWQPQLSCPRDLTWPLDCLYEPCFGSKFLGNTRLGFFLVHGKPIPNCLTNHVSSLGSQGKHTVEEVNGSTFGELGLKTWFFVQLGRGCKCLSPWGSCLFLG
jgi:hypothetical protein